MASRSIRFGRFLSAAGTPFVMVLCLASTCCFARAQSAGLTPTELKTSMRSNPLGIAKDAVTFGWVLQSKSPEARSQRQTAYRILVASSTANLSRQKADVWDSSRIASAVYWQLPFHGPLLQAHTTYYWKAEVWDEASRVGRWSAVASFTTGLDEADWTAKWIAAEKDADTPLGSGAPLPVFRHDFTTRGPIKSAVVFVSGLGQYELRLNGSNVTSTVLNPGWMNYRKSIPYDTYDVTSLLRSGANAFAMLLGNGMYNVEEMKGRYTKFTGSFGKPRCRVQMEVRYQDGTSERFISDESWKSHAGPITFSSIYGGEDEDARVLPKGWDMPGFHTQDWQQAFEVGGPGGKMIGEVSSQMVIAETYKTRVMTTPKPGLTVYDLGENMSGWPDIEVRGEPGAKVTLLPGELLASDGTVSQRSTNAFPDSAVLFHYTLRGGPTEQWHPRFSYHSFRYVQVSVEAAAPGGNMPQVISLAGDFVHAKAPVVGQFSSSNELFNRIHLLIDRAVLSNLASVVTDCPSREKLGWLEQTYLNAGTLMDNYDVTGLYEKMAIDIADAQLKDGLVPSIAPEYVAFVDGNGKSNAFRDSPEWGSAVILSPWALYQYTGDSEPLAAHYENMQRYAAYLESRQVNGLLNFGLGDWYDIGPKPPGPSQLTSRAVTATGVFYEDLSALARIALLLGHNVDAQEYEREAVAVRERFNANFFHPETDQYDRGSQTANALALALGLVPAAHRAAVLEHLVADIHAHTDHVTSGDIGFHYLVRALTDNGRSDVLAAMLSRTDSPSYGYQLARGATTLTEAWDANPDSSQNHFMLGHGEEWFYRGLAGLSVDMSMGPQEAITLQPSFLRTIDHASASYLSAMGLVKVAWQRTAEKDSVDITIPAGAQAHLNLPPLGNWEEKDTPVAQAAGVLSSKPSAAGIDMLLGSGSYHFSTLPISTAVQGDRPLE
jgi:alpha-L-rhamnosidase